MTRMVIYLIGVGIACPPQRHTKTGCWSVLQASPWFARLDRRARLIAERVLQRENGIEGGRLAVDSLEAAFNIDPDTLDARFVAHAPQLAANAARRAMADVSMESGDLDAVIVQRG